MIQIILKGKKLVQANSKLQDLAEQDQRNIQSNYFFAQEGHLLLSRRKKAKLKLESMKPQSLWGYVDPLLNESKVEAI